MQPTSLFCNLSQISCWYRSNFGEKPTIVVPSPLGATMLIDISGVGAAELVVVAETVVRRVVDCISEVDDGSCTDDEGVLIT